MCVDGDALRVRTRTVVGEFERSGPLMHALLRHTESLISQMSQLVACNRHHALEQQLCRLLLATLDRTADRHLHMTHEAMATRLGVRREGVTIAANALRDARVIGYVRGRITVHDRRALETRACECYSVIARECARLLR